MPKKQHKPETQAVLARLSIEAFEKLRKEAIEAKRSIGSQAAVILEARYAQSKEQAA